MYNDIRTDKSTTRKTHNRVRSIVLKNAVEFCVVITGKKLTTQRFNNNIMYK